MLKIRHGTERFCCYVCLGLDNSVTYVYDGFIVTYLYGGVILKDFSKFAYCWHCGKEFKFERSDARFCSGACVAAYYRANPNPPPMHEAKPHVHTYYCENCAASFEVNDYAKREGKRRPKYCSPKCKQAAYRQRKQGEPQPQAKRRYPGNEQKARSNTHSGSTGQSGRQNQQNAGNGHSGAKSGHTGSSNEFWKGATNRTAAAMGVLGLTGDFTQRQLRAAWIKAIKAHHPDVNSDAAATWKAQQINWAYEYLKK